MADALRARRLSDHEGQTLTQIVRRGRGNSIRVRRATDLDPAVVTELLREAVAHPPGELR